MWEGVNLDLCSPDEKARHAQLKIGDMTIRRNDTLVTYVSRDLEPYRGVHTMIRALPALLRARKNLKVVMLGGDGVSYGAAAPNGGTWREVFLKEVADQIDASRIVFPGRIEYATYLALLRRSDAHVYLTYPFVASWSLRESLAMGCAIVGSDTEPVREFITHGRNGLLTSFFEPQGLADAVLEVVEDKRLDQKLRAGARRYAERNLSMDDYLRAYRQKIELLTGGSLVPGETRTARAVQRRVKEPPVNV
jgi:glycosyltransferase involved in cell wall biosynthesis